MRGASNVLWTVGAVVGLAAGCASKPATTPRILSSVSPPGAYQAPPLNSGRPIAVPGAPVGANLPVIQPVGTPVIAIPAQPAGQSVPAQPGPTPRNSEQGNGQYQYGQTDAERSSTRRQDDYDDLDRRREQDSRPLVPPRP